LSTDQRRPRHCERAGISTALHSRHGPLVLAGVLVSMS
jgi:hypothetical protein